jgi:GMP synthase (glutamine-hydrolysing)
MNEHRMEAMELQMTSQERPIGILKVGSAPEVIARRLGDFERWVEARAGLSPGEALVIDATTLGVSLPGSADLAGVIVTGSPAMVTDHHPWSENAARWIAQLVAAETPLLGICYGHQLLGYALGAEVGDNPRGQEFGATAIQLTNEAQADPVFSECLGNREQAKVVYQAHQQSVLTLPEGARVLALNEMDPHQAFAVGSCAWGVQFHPEFSSAGIMAYLKLLAHELEREGLDLDALVSRVGEERGFGARLLRSFVAFVRRRERPEKGHE